MRFCIIFVVKWLNYFEQLRCRHTVNKIPKDNIINRFFACLQYILPQHFLSRLMGKVGECRLTGFKNTLIRWWIKRYNVSMEEAETEDITQYSCFNDFFTRSLKPEVRLLPDDEAIIVSPADGAISQQGMISDGRIFQAKGFDFSVKELVGGDNVLSNLFSDGLFSTIYLSPRDYHRVHMPCDGTLRKMVYIPGNLFSVNKVTTEHVPRLFARNERVVCLFDTPVGAMIMVLVGAMVVASIETVWHGEVTPVRRRVNTWTYDNKKLLKTFKRGDEIGRFKLGSTVILLFQQNAIEWNDNLNIDALQMGQYLAKPVAGTAHD